MKVWQWVLAVCALIGIMVVCICVGSVNVPLAEVGQALMRWFTQQEVEGKYQTIIYHVRLPRVLATMFVGMLLSLSGAVMQGLLQNPLADGSTLGVSSGASLGAVLAIALGLSFPGIPLPATMVMAVLFAFLSLMLILSLSYRIDQSLSTMTIILMGMIFSMFASSAYSLLLVYAQEQVKSIVFWSMGSLAASSYQQVLILAITFVVVGGWVLLQGQVLNAFAIGEANASQIGVDTRRVRLRLLIAISMLIGVAVAVGGSIAFVGLVVPHMMRRLIGPNHQRLLPAVVLAGGSFLMLADLLARTLFSPVELPIGVVTSLVGASLFIVIFMRERRRGNA